MQRLLFLGILGVLLLPVGIVTTIVGVVSGTQGTVGMGVIELIGGALFILVGFAALPYFRRRRDD